MKKLKQVCSSFTVFLLNLLVLLSEPRSSNGVCQYERNITDARCHYLEDIKFINTYGLKRLKILSVDNHLSSDYFNKLANLKHLDLSNGKLNELKQNVFLHLKHLESLDLSNNKLIKIEKNTFKGLTKLELLNLSSNLLDNVPIDLIDMQSLNYLDINNNKMSCDCQNLKLRDELFKINVRLENNWCSRPNNMKGRPFIEPDAEAVCILDMDEGMQMDQPSLDGSGESSGDAFDDIDTEDVPEDDDLPSTNETRLAANTNNETLTTMENLVTGSTPVDVPLTGSTPTLTSTVVSMTNGSKITPEILKSSLSEPKKENEMWPTEGSGDDDGGEDPFLEGSGGEEGSGIGTILPRIKWDFDEDFGRKLDEDDEQMISSSTSPPSSESTTEAEGFIETLYDFFWGQPEPVTETSTSSDLDLEGEQFIDVSSTSEATQSENKTPATEEIIVPLVSKPVNKDSEVFKSNVSNETKVGEVKAEEDNNTEAPDASAAKQSKKGMGSYIVLGILLGVLTTLIGLAAYKGDFCKAARKRRNNPGVSDVENGTEMKDLRKSLLDNSNSVQPKISSNGNATESDPLMNSSDKKNDDEPKQKFAGVMSESSADPIKPPRKSFSPNELYEEEMKNGTNGKAITVPELTNNSKPKDSVVYNGRNDRDSLASSGESHSIGSHLSNPRLSQRLSSGSPNAQRVKITLQDNPDSIPKTPLLITRTKAGENLVKNP